MPNRPFNSKLQAIPSDGWPAVALPLRLHVCPSCLCSTRRTGHPHIYGFLEEPTAVHSAPAVSTLSITKAKPCQMSQLMAYKTVGPQNSKYVGFHLHLNGGLKSSTQAVCHASKSTRVEVNEHIESVELIIIN